MNAIKWIVIDGNFIMSRASFHKDMIPEGSDSKPVGGGMANIREHGSHLELFGSSFDFGRCRSVDVTDAIENDKMYSNSRCTHSIKDRFSKITFNNGVETFTLYENS